MNFVCQRGSMKYKQAGYFFCVIVTLNCLLFEIGSAAEIKTKQITEKLPSESGQIEPSQEPALDLEKKQNERRRVFLKELSEEASEFWKKLDSEKDQKEQEKLIEEFRKSRLQKVEAFLASEKEVLPKEQPAALQAHELKENESNQRN